MPLSDNARQAYAFFINKGWSPQAASGIIGNLMGESGGGLDPSSDGDKTIPGHSKGIAQWNGPRRDALNAYAQANGASPGDFHTQLGFIDHELNTTEKTTGNLLRAAQNPTQAASAAIGYERPRGWTADNPEGGDAYAARNRASMATYAEMAGQSPQSMAMSGSVTPTTAQGQSPFAALAQQAMPGATAAPVPSQMQPGQSQQPSQAPPQPAPAPAPQGPKPTGFASGLMSGLSKGLTDPQSNLHKSLAGMAQQPGGMMGTIFGGGTPAQPPAGGIGSDAVAAPPPAMPDKPAMADASPQPSTGLFSGIGNMFSGWGG